jgi:hypothetical protein
VQSADVAQAVLQPALVQVYRPQVVVSRAPQVPAPSQSALRVTTLPAQLSVRHAVLALGKAHAVRVLPSQVPPHRVLSLAQAARAPRGAPATARQVPALPDSAQASHWPSQALLQQTPSVQNPVVHWLPWVHAAPFAFTGRHRPAAQ